MAKRILLVLVLLMLTAAGRVCPAGEDKDFSRAHYLYTLQEYKLAAEAFAKYLNDYLNVERSRSEQARLLLAESLYQLKDYSKAAEQFDKFLNDYPSSARRADGLQRAVKVHWQAKEFEKSIQCADTFLKENTERLGKPDTPPALPKLFEQVLYFGGDACYMLKKYERACTLWGMLQKDYPQSKLIPDTAEGLGWIAFENKRFEDALKNFSISAGTPDYPRAATSQFMTARALDQLGKTNEALAALDKVAGLTSDDKAQQARQVALWRPAFLLKAKRYPEAIAAYRALAQGFGADADTPVAVFQGVVEIDKQNLPAATLEIADLYLTSFPKGAARAPVARVKAMALNALKRSEAAVAAARDALKEAEALPAKSPEYNEHRPAALMLLAELLGPAGKAQYEIVAKEHANTPFAAPARYQLAFLAAKEDKLQDAFTLAEALLKDLPAGQKDNADLYRQTLFAVSDFAFRLKQDERAEKYLKLYSDLPAVKADPASMQLGVVLLRMAWCRHRAGDFAGAIALLNQIMASAAPADRDELLYLRGRSLLDILAKNTAAPDAAALQKNLQDYATLVKDTPNSSFAALACLDAAQVLSKCAAPAEALPWLDKLLDNPAFAESALRTDGLLLRAKARYASGKHAEAIRDVDTLLKQKDLKQKEQAPVAYLLRALCLEAMPGKEAEAEKAYTQVIETLPAGTPEVRIGILQRANMRFNAKRYPEAEADLRAFLGGKEPKPDDTAEVVAAVRIALCRKEQKDAPGAQAQFEKLAKLPLTGLAAFEVPFQLGNLAYEANKHLDAAAQYEKAIEAAAKLKDFPRATLSDVWRALAWSYRRANEAKKAETAFAELVKLDPLGPLSAEARYYRGRLLAEAGDTDGALAQWKELLDKQAASPLAEKALASMGEAQAKSSKFAEAAKTFEEYLAKFPAGSAVRETWCGLAECRMQLKNLDGAREAFLKALGDKGLDAELDEPGARAVLGIAEMALNKGEAGEGKKQALRVVIDCPDSKWLDAALYLCGRASEDLKEQNQAIGYYRKLLAERPQSERAATAKERLKALGAPAAEK